MKTALVVIDVQMALAHDDANGAERSCPQAEQNIKALLAAFRERGNTVVHVHHHGRDPEDPFYENAEGSLVQPYAKPTDIETRYIKYASSAFTGTSLEANLRAQNVERLMMCDATANK